MIWWRVTSSLSFTWNRKGPNHFMMSWLHSFTSKTTKSARRVSKLTISSFISRDRYFRKTIFTSENTTSGLFQTKGGRSELSITPIKTRTTWNSLVFSEMSKLLGSTSSSHHTMPDLSVYFIRCQLRISRTPWPWKTLKD